ncbi:hypothetical protein PAA8504_00758 [Palleronia abyssalis]|uniref:Uncharacterized protein n=1 Tax=Palleronia abyssalis TaxID=1501240 RepID=A0A2R8BS04_9RHOB|nr:hypothetical protein PAA8504_00758 [Palleronia abyssalis]
MRFRTEPGKLAITLGVEEIAALLNSASSSEPGNLHQNRWLMHSLLISEAGPS